MFLEQLNICLILHLLFKQILMVLEAMRKGDNSWATHG